MACVHFGYELGINIHFDTIAQEHTRIIIPGFRRVGRRKSAKGPGITSLGMSQGQKD